MKTRLLLIACLVMALLEIASAQNRTPNHWLAAGSRPDQYVMTLDKNEKHGGSASARIECIAIEPSGFGTLMQTFNASDYLGKRVRMSAWMKTSNADAAQLWMRLDGTNELLGFDNMQPRRVIGSTEWKKYELTLDVPQNTITINFGAFVAGRGQAWVDDYSFEVVDQSVPTTNLIRIPQPMPGAGDVPAPAQAGNLDFEQ